MHIISFRNVGSPRVPHDIQRLRRENVDLLRRMGQPVIWKHMFSQDDLETGGYQLAVSGRHTNDVDLRRCPACWDSEYDNIRADCPVCFGVGIVSVQTQPRLWLTSNGRLTTNPNVGVELAPRWGGYGPSVLTWTAQPDVAEDIFRLSDQGVLTKVSNAQAYAPWTPEMNDNDLLINVELRSASMAVSDDFERFQLKQTNPQTVRGYGGTARGREHQVGQQFEMTLIPKPNILHSVPVDPIFERSFTDRGLVIIPLTPSGIEEKV